MKPPILITGNHNKLIEINEILFPLKLKAHSLNLPEIQSLNPIEIVKFKAKEAYKITKQPILIEDTSLYIKNLNNFPGPLIKWFLESLKPKGIAKLTKGSLAKAETLFCLFTGKHFHIFKGIKQGKITTPKGKTNFGWDSIFIPNGNTKTYAQMTTQEKNKISHRYLALKKLKEFLKNKINKNSNNQC